MGPVMRLRVLVGRTALMMACNRAPLAGEGRSELWNPVRVRLRGWQSGRSPEADRVRRSRAGGSAAVARRRPTDCGQAAPVCAGESLGPNLSSLRRHACDGFA
eukprot:SAG31_NODE_2590_length_5426_cov_4.118265_10_plen_103_part_00